MLHLTKHSVIGKLRNTLEHGAPRSGAIMAVSSGVGILSGKRGDVKTVPVASAIAGVGLNLLGFHTLGDGALAGAATLIGYKHGAKRKPVAIPTTAAPRRK